MNQTGKGERFAGPPIDLFAAADGLPAFLQQRRNFAVRGEAIGQFSRRRDQLIQGRLRDTGLDRSKAELAGDLRPFL